MSNKSAPYGHVDNSKDKVDLWFLYGHLGMRDGILPPGQNPGVVMGTEHIPDQCQQPTNTMTDDYLLRCGPFRLDYWTAPLDFPIRNEDVSSMPPR